MSGKKNNPTKKYAKNKGGQTKTRAKIPFLPLAIILLALISIGYFALRDDNTGLVSATDKVYKGTSGIVGDSDPESLRGGETKPVLSPSRFRGKTAASYQLAKDNRELLDSMYCYCFCKRTIGHKSLLSCFTDGHASNCTICQDQAFYAEKMHDKGLDIAEVRKAVDRKFWRPFS